MALVNDRLGLGFEVVTRKDQLPCLYQWQNFQAGQYALGIEPSTHHVLGDHRRARARRDDLARAWRGRAYDAVFRVLDGAGEIAAAERRIRAIATAAGGGLSHGRPGNFRALGAGHDAGQQ